MAFIAILPSIFSAGLNGPGKSNKGVPNRLRIDRYRALVARSGLEKLMIEPVETAPLSEVKAVHSCLAAQFRGLSDEDLTWLSFWMILQRPVSV